MEQETPLTFDEILTDKDYQAEFDKRVAKAINTATTKAKAQWEEEYQKKMEMEKSEAEKLANMKEAEKHKYELEQERKAKEQAISELNAYKLEKEVHTRAEEKGLPISMLNGLDYTRLKAEDIDDIIQSRKNDFDKALENAMNERYKEKTPFNNATETPSNKTMPKFF